jgi:glycosyltransferase involved in cell wall biosynthesis
MDTIALSNTSATEQSSNASKLLTGKKTLSVYLMDMWSFIPYYMARLCANLQSETVNATLGSARYHLDRHYFLNVGLMPDTMLLDRGGDIRNAAVRRILKSCEYLINLTILSLRFIVSRPDILHVQYFPFLDHGFRFEIWFLRWVRRLRVPIVYTVHNVTYQDAPGRHKPLYKRAYHMADALICHGEEARLQLMQDFEVPQDRISVIPHGPLFEQKPEMSSREARKKLGLQNQAPLVLCLGVISEYKGIPFLLDAWKRLAEYGTEGRLLIAGTGDPGLLASIREKVSVGNLESSVDLWLHFIPVDQLPVLFTAADILVYPYKAGTTSGALLTGLNYNKPIIATKLAFFREYLRDGDNALLVDYGDVGALSSSLRSLLENQGERLRMKTSLERDDTRRDSWLEIAKSTRHCYDRVLDAHRLRGGD